MTNSNKDFSKQVIKTLAAQGLTIVGTQLMPENGSFAPGRLAYLLSNGKYRYHAEVRILGGETSKSILRQAAK